MRQVDLLLGDVICFSDGFTLLVVQREGGSKGERVKWLNLCSGKASPLLNMHMEHLDAPIRGEVYRGGAIVHTPSAELAAKPRWRASGRIT